MGSIIIMAAVEDAHSPLSTSVIILYLNVILRLSCFVAVSVLRSNSATLKPYQLSTPLAFARMHEVRYIMSLVSTACACVIRYFAVAELRKNCWNHA